MTRAIRFRFIPLLEQDVATSILDVTFDSHTGVEKRATSPLTYGQLTRLGDTLQEWLHLAQKEAEPPVAHRCTTIEEIGFTTLSGVNVELILSACTECNKLYLSTKFLSDQLDAVSDDTAVPMSYRQLVELHAIIEASPHRSGYCNIGATEFAMRYSTAPAATLTRDLLVINTPIPQRFAITIDDDGWQSLTAIAGNFNSEDDELDRSSTIALSADRGYVTIEATRQPGDLLDDDLFITTVRIRIVDRTGSTIHRFSLTCANQHDGADAVVISDNPRAIVFHGLSMHFVP